MLHLKKKIEQCIICAEHLPFGPRPVVQLSPSSKLLIIGQAPGRKVHDSGIPWDDVSGRTLRRWLGISEETFYNPDLVSIMPMAFCYPGKGPSGDLAPRKECAPLWHSEVLRLYKEKPLILLIGTFAQRYYLRKTAKPSLTETVRNFREYLPGYFPLPHPSPRNQNWVKVNPWFNEYVIPELQLRISELLH